MVSSILAVFVVSRLADVAGAAFTTYMLPLYIVGNIVMCIHY